jgi:hypothetical protein
MKHNDQQISNICCNVCVESGLLRYKVDFQSMQLDDMDEDLYNLDDY